MLGLGSYQTAWTILHKLRGAMVRPERSRLSGDVEVDETLIGGVNHGGKRGRGAGRKSLVVIAVEVLTEGFRPNPHAAYSRSFRHKLDSFRLWSGRAWLSCDARWLEGLS